MEYTEQKLVPSIPKIDISDIHVGLVEHGVVLPYAKDSIGNTNGLGGVLHANYEYETKSGLSENGYLKYGGKYDFDISDIEDDQEDAIWFGLFKKHWGHFIIELVCRLWYVIENYKGQKIVYISEDGELMDGNFLEFLNYLNIPNSNIKRVTRPTRFNTITIPDYCATERFYSDYYIQIFNTVINNSKYWKLDHPAEKYVYFTRRNFFYSKFKDFGEKRVEDIFNQNNFKSIAPEKLSLREQILVWNESKEIVSVNGSIPLNIVFSTKKPSVIVLNKTRRLHGNLVNISKILDYPITYVDAYYPKYDKLIKNMGSGPFIIYLSPYLRNFLKDNKFVFEYTIYDKFIKLRAMFYVAKFFFYEGCRIILKKVKLRSIIKKIK
ncbi:MAG: glycosyltransferase 61 family protein [Chitinophagaceae bacterium]